MEGETPAALSAEALAKGEPRRTRRSARQAGAGVFVLRAETREEFHRFPPISFGRVLPIHSLALAATEPALFPGNTWGCHDPAVSPSDAGPGDT
jgi:hypothetical protein